MPRKSPCPCGSGKKYKRCCLPRHEQLVDRHEKRVQGLSQALDWLLRAYPGPTLHTLDTEFYGVVREEDRPILHEMPEIMRDCMMSNAYEWLMVEGEITVDGERRPARERILGPQCPGLGAGGREWIEQAAVSPLRVYEVVGVRRGLGCDVRDLAADAPAVQVTEPATWENFRVGDILGLRLVRIDDVWQRSVANYAFDPWSLPDIEAEIRRVDDEVSDPAARSRALGDGIRELWTEIVFQSFRKAADDEGEPLPN